MTMTDTVLHRDMDTIDRSTPNGRIKSQLLGLYNIIAPNEMVNILDEAPLPIRTNLADYLANTIVKEVLTFLQSNSTLLGIDTSKLSDMDKEVLFITKLDEHQTAISFACGGVIYDRVHNSVAIHYYNPYKNQNLYHVYYPQRRVDYINLGYEISYYDTDTQEYRPFFGTLSAQLDTFTHRLELVKDSFLLDK